MSELKPCPFCGSEMQIIEDAEFENVYGHKTYNVSHDENTDCPAEIIDHCGDKDKDRLIKAWNTRSVDVDAIIKDIEDAGFYHCDCQRDIVIDYMELNQILKKHLLGGE